MAALSPYPALISVRPVHTTFLMKTRFGRGALRRMAVLGSPDSPKKALRPTQESSTPVKAAWYASEAFGWVAGFLRGNRVDASEINVPVYSRDSPLLRKTAMDLLREDYDYHKYFVTGTSSMEAYDSQCEFADPFVSFRGLARFRANVSNLGAFMEDVRLKTEFSDGPDDNSITANWRFRCVLGLPWRPSLSASGSTVHVFDEDTGLIVRHIENWDISAIDGLRQVFKIRG